MATARMERCCKEREGDNNIDMKDSISIDMEDSISIDMEDSVSRPCVPL